MRCGRSWGKKEKRCDRTNEGDAGLGSQWDHDILDAETKLLVSLVIGPRTEENAKAVWSDFRERTDGVAPDLITTDEYKPYRGAILAAYGESREFPRTGRPGRPRMGRLEAAKGLVYATVHKTREKGRVVDVSLRRVFGTKAQLDAALKESSVSSHGNTSFVERFNGTVRQHNSRKARKTYAFSKEFDCHQAMSWFAAAYYNFCRPHLGLRLRQEERWSPRTPAMAAGLSKHMWSLEKFMRHPLVHKSFAVWPKH